ncbi:phosphatidylinositol 3-kinase 2 [Tieghemostelium lacteum]|uniref:Phosphatidylinositol 3-kinase 2 n=1 Tax=Tieghemostelium lacteum TaxID=361077 RepID=A0A152A8W0_TIELA|nr:phosphatidylinositol 3-kinase 2 [Tieghemostelium lacteum]|eukprot:KYR02658.1 phosphatidylinositol 3-kinase 2 [Tieghemostelium lacteum]
MKPRFLVLIYLIICCLLVPVIISNELENKPLTTAITTPPTPLKGSDVTTSFVSELTVEPAKKGSTTSATTPKPGTSSTTSSTTSATTSTTSTTTSSPTSSSTSGGTGASSTSSTTSSLSTSSSSSSSSTLSTSSTTSFVDSAPSLPEIPLPSSSNIPIQSSSSTLASSSSTLGSSTTGIGLDPSTRGQLTSGGGVDSIAELSSKQSSTLGIQTSGFNDISSSPIGHSDGGGEYYLPSDLVCLGFQCPNGVCVLSSQFCNGQTNGIIQRCPYDNPVRCPDGSCNITSALCPPAEENCGDNIICPNGKCGPCPEYDGCSVDIPFQCPNGICTNSISGCEVCSEGGHLKCFDGSCTSPCPYPPFYYKPITIHTTISQSQQSTLIPVNSYNSPLNYNTSLQRIVDIIIEPDTFPLDTSLYISGVSDSYTSQVNCDYYWPNDFQFQLLLLSPVINITAVARSGHHKTRFDKKIKFDFTLVRDIPKVTNQEVCLGFINEHTMQWECVPNLVEIIEEPGVIRVVAYTDHFTSFALLTTYHSDRNSIWGEKGKRDIKMIVGVALGCVGAAVLIVFAGVVYHYSSKHGSLRNWLISVKSQTKKGSTPINSPKMSDPDLLSSSNIKLSSSTERPSQIF